VHLFLDYDFAKACWACIGLQIPDWYSPFQVLLHFKNELWVPFFMNFLILLTWCIGQLEMITSSRISFQHFLQSKKSLGMNFLCFLIEQKVVIFLKLNGWLSQIG
jgi:hypothetical protein